MAGEKIAQQFSENTVDIFNIANTPITTITNYRYIILGIPTWDYGELQEDWENIWQTLDQLNLQNTTIALYGLGDQIGYPDWFLDAMGYLYHKVLSLGAQVVGFWPNEGYDFNESQALTDDKRYFVGLALDDENEFDKTDERITQWCNALKPHFGITI